MRRIAGLIIHITNGTHKTWQLRYTSITKQTKVR